MASVGSELLNEIGRVCAKRERWEEYARASGPQANFRPVLHLMTMAINNAKKAIADDDAVASIAALKALRDFDDQD